MMYHTWIMCTWLFLSCKFLGQTFFVNKIISNVMETRDILINSSFTSYALNCWNQWQSLNRISQYFCLFFKARIYIRAELQIRTLKHKVVRFSSENPTSWCQCLVKDIQYLSIYANISEMETGFSLVNFPFSENPVYLMTV